ncbi:MAG TPA: phage tail tape measure protein, partial [Gemmatimonadaceae bacterium]
MAKEREVTFTVRAKDAATAVMKQVENSAKGTIQGLVSLKSVFKELSGAFAGLTLGILVKDMLELGVASDKAFRQIANNLPTATEGIQELEASIRDLARTTGRSLEELQSTAVEISRLGVGSADELAERLRAASTFANATGMDLKATVGGLDQIMDAFNITAGEAEESLAKIRSAAKGRVDVESMFDAFQKATPLFQQLGIDADTGARALVRLLDAGHNVKQVGAEIAKFDASGIRKLAEGAHISATALEELREQDKRTREGLAATNQQLKNEFIATLGDVGTAIMAKLNTPLQGLVEITRLIKSEGLLNVLAAALGDSHNMPATPASQAGPIKWTNAKKDVLPPADGDMPLTKEQIQKLEEAKKKLADLRVEVTKLAQTTTEAKSKSEQFADTIDEWAKKARDAGMSAQEFAVHMDELYDTLQRIQDAENIDKIQEGIKKLAPQLIKSTEAAGKFADAIQELLNKAKESGMIKVADLPKIAPPEDTGAKVRKIASEWATVGRTIVAASQAIGEMDERTAAALQNAVTFGEGVARIFSGDAIGGGAQTVTSLAALLTGNSAGAERERVRVLERNTDALKELTRKAASGGLIGRGVDLSGSTANAALEALRKVFFSASPNGMLPAYAKVDLSKVLSPEQIRAVEDAARALGIELDNTGGSLQALYASLSNSLPILGEFADDFAGAMSELEASKAIFGSQGPLQDFAAYIQSVAKYSPVVRELLASLPSDASQWSADDLARIKAAAQEWFQLMQAGGEALDPEQMGITGDAFLEFIKTVVGAVDDIGNAAHEAALKL